MSPHVEYEELLPGRLWRVTKWDYLSRWECGRCSWNGYDPFMVRLEDGGDLQPLCPPCAEPELARLLFAPLLRQLLEEPAEPLEAPT